jgi:hypothetical protein
MPTQFDYGFLVGLLVGEGHFGGDGRQPQVTLRMHVRHEAIFQWLERTFPGGRLYGPYHHAERHYLQWMARGPYLRDELVPILDRFLSPSLDQRSFDRYQLMKTRYPELAADLAADGELVSPSARPRRAASRPAARRTAAKAAPANEPTAPSTMPAGDPATFDELLAELRETWPS